MITNHQYNISYGIALILFASITFYLAKITPISPIYVIYLIFLPMLAIVYFFSNKIILSIDVLLLIIVLLYILLSNIYFDHLNLNGEFINFYIGAIAYIFIRGIKYKISNEEYVKIIEASLKVSISILLISTLFRISNPDAPDGTLNYIYYNEDSSFYLYKYNSLLFADSNTTGLIVLILHFFVLIAEKTNKLLLVPKYYKFTLIALIFLSFSRAAIFTFLLVQLIIKIFSIKSILYKFLLISLVISTIVSIIFYIFLDASFLVKFNILNLVYHYLQTASENQLLFGIGPGNAKEYLGIYTHSLYLTYLVETGIVGFIFFFIFIVYYMYKYDFYVLFSVLIVSISYFLYLGAPFLFLPLAILANLKDRRYK